ACHAPRRARSRRDVARDGPQPRLAHRLLARRCPDMIKKYIEKLFGRRERVTHKDAKPVVYPKEKHGIGREHISRCARKTCEELQRAGYSAFVVGGAVRDL